MSLKSTDIDFDLTIEKFRTRLAMDLHDGNPLMLKARAELYLDIFNGIAPIIDAAIAEFAEKYGEEVIKYAHNNLDETDIGPQSTVKYVSSREIQTNLHKQLLLKETQDEA